MIHPFISEDILYTSPVFIPFLILHGQTLEFFKQNQDCQIRLRGSCRAKDSETGNQDSLGCSDPIVQSKGIFMTATNSLLKSAKSSLFHLNLSFDTYILWFKDVFQFHYNWLFDTFVSTESTSFDYDIILKMINTISNIMSVVDFDPIFDKFLSNTYSSEAILSLLFSNAPVEYIIHVILKLREKEILQSRRASAFMNEQRKKDDLQNVNSNFVSTEGNEGNDGRELPKYHTNRQIHSNFNEELTSVPMLDMLNKNDISIFKASWQVYLIFYIVTFPTYLTHILQLLTAYILDDRNTDAKEDVEQFLCLLASESSVLAVRIREICLENHLFPMLILKITYNLGDTLYVLPSLLHSFKGESSNPNDQTIPYLLTNATENDIWAQELRQSLWNLINDDTTVRVETCSSIRLICVLALHKFYICDKTDDYRKLDFYIRRNSHAEGKAKYLLENQIIPLFYCLCFISIGRDTDICQLLISELTLYLWESNLGIDTLLLLATILHSSSFDRLTRFILEYIDIGSMTSDSISKIESGRSYSKKTSMDLSTILTMDNLHLISRIFNSMIPVQALAEKILTDQKPKSCSTNEDWYVLQCIYRMLKSRLFRKHSISPTDWILKQIQLCDIHHLPDILIKIIYQLVENTVPHPHFEFQVKFIEQAEIEEVLKRSQRRNDTENLSNYSNIVIQALLIYYILDVNATTKLESFKTEIFSHFQIFRIFDFLHDYRERIPILFEKLYPLMIDQLQFAFEIKQLLEEEHELKRGYHTIWFATDNSEVTSINHENLIATLRKPLFNQAETANVFRIIFNNASILNEDVQTAFISTLHSLLQDNVEQYLCESFARAWKRLYIYSPVKLGIQTINSLHFSDDRESHTYMVEDYFKNILLLFGVNKRVFYNPQLLEIFLIILRSYMVASSKYVSQIHMNSSYPSPPVIIDEELKRNCVLTQDSTVIQVLLELCLPSSHEFTVNSLQMEVVQKKICDFVHNLFLENPVLAKLIHFQTYSHELLPITTTKIDCIHICIDFLMDIISHSSLETQAFGIQLAAYLMHRYPLQRCVEIAQTAIQRIRNYGLIGSGSKSKSVKKTVLQLLDSLILISKTFPFLIPQCVETLSEIQIHFDDESIKEKSLSVFASSISITI